MNVAYNVHTTFCRKFAQNWQLPYGSTTLQGGCRPRRAGRSRGWPGGGRGRSCLHGGLARGTLSQSFANTGEVVSILSKSDAFLKHYHLEHLSLRERIQNSNLYWIMDCSPRGQSHARRNISLTTAVPLPKSCFRQQRTVRCYSAERQMHHQTIT